MATRKSNRKSKKSNKRFRKTRSKRQRGSGNTCSSPGSCIVDRNNITEEMQENLNELLIWASQRGHTAQVARLLAAGANVNATDINGSTALMWASEFGRTETVAMLLQNGANVNAQNDEGKTALDEADYMVEVQEILKLYLPSLGDQDSEGGDMKYFLTPGSF